jgi:hypothetical protein
MRSSGRTLPILTLLACSLSATFLPTRTQAEDHAPRPEETEWTWEVRPEHVDTNLPNVLLVGDSITRNYYPEIRRQLSEVANVYLFATSASVGDPRLLRQLDEFSTMESISFNVIHFNNGMHGWTYSEAEYKVAFPSLLSKLHEIAPNASLIWATITPVKLEDKPGPTNARIDTRNSIAQSFLESSGIKVDDQHALMSHHAEQYEDKVHFNSAGAVIQGQQAAQVIRSALIKK